MNCLETLVEDILVVILNKLSNPEQFELAQTSMSMMKYIRNYRRENIRKNHEKEIVKLIKNPFSNISNNDRVHHALMNDQLDLFKYYESIGIVPKILYKVGGNPDIIDYVISQGYELSLWCLLYAIRFNNQITLNKLISWFPNIKNYYTRGLEAYCVYQCSDMYKNNKWLDLYEYNGQTRNSIKNIPSSNKIYYQLCKYGTLSTIILFDKLIPNVSRYINYIIKFNRIDVLTMFINEIHKNTLMSNAIEKCNILIINYLRYIKVDLVIYTNTMSGIVKKEDRMSKLKFLLD